MDLTALTSIPEPIVLRQPNKTKKEFQMKPMDLGAWQLFKTIQLPENKDNLDLTYKLMQRIVPDIDRATFDLLTTTEASLIIVNATGAIGSVIDELGKD